MAADPLEQLTHDEKQRLAELVKGNTSRRDMLKAGGALGVGALVGGGGYAASTQNAKADASTSDSDGDVGTPSNPIDAYADGVDVFDGANNQIGSLDENGLDIPSVETVEATIDNIVVRQGTDADRTRYVGDDVMVSGGATVVIFDLTDPVDIITGNIIGMDLVDVTVTYGDGTTEQLYSSRFLGKDQAGDQQGVVPLPPVKSVTKLTFTNNANSHQNDFGWGVMTI